MRFASALTGRTIERVTQTASATAASSARPVMIRIRRVPPDAVALASETDSAAAFDVASISLSPACSNAVSASSSSPVKRCASRRAPRTFSTVSARESATMRVCASFSVARALAYASYSCSTGVPATSFSSCGIVGRVLVLVGLELAGDPVLGLEVAVVDVQVLGDQAQVVLGALLDAADELRDPEVTVGEVVGFVAHAVHRVHAGEGDDRQQQAECTEGASKPHGERKIADGGHVTEIGTTRARAEPVRPSRI